MYIPNDKGEVNTDKAYREKILNLLTSRNHVVQQYMARLFNTIASLCDGYYIIYYEICYFSFLLLITFFIIR